MAQLSEHFPFLQEAAHQIRIPVHFGPQQFHGQPEFGAIEILP